jgi:hypothetical protein
MNGLDGVGLAELAALLLIIVDQLREKLQARAPGACRVGIVMSLLR